MTVVAQGLTVDQMLAHILAGQIETRSEMQSLRQLVEECRHLNATERAGVLDAAQRISDESAFVNRQLIEAFERLRGEVRALQDSHRQLRGELAMVTLGRQTGPLGGGRRMLELVSAGD